MVQINLDCKPGDRQAAKNVRAWLTNACLLLELLKRLLELV